MAKTQAVWALDIGQAALKALKLVPAEMPDEVVAEAFDFIEYPKILSQPDADPETLVQQALTTFLERNDLTGSRVAIAVPGQAGLVKFIKLPPVEKKRIPDIVKFEARQQIPFALEEVIWAYQPIGSESDEDDDTMAVEVGLFAMKRDQINRAILPLTAAGIEVDIVQMAPIALYNYAAYDYLADHQGGGSVVFLDIGADNTDLIITDGKRIWQRNVPIGGNHFTRALTKELKQTFAKAEHLKRNATKAQDPRAVFTAMRGIFNDFSSEVSRSIGFYSSVNRTAKIAKVVGLGNGFKLPGLQKFLQQNLGHEVERLETFKRLQGDEVLGAPQFQENLVSFAVAYGLAVQGLNLAPLKTNLLPPEIEKVRLIRAKKPWVLAASALLMIGFAALSWSDARALSKVSSPAFESAVSQAESVSKRGAGFESDFNSAKSEFQSKYDEGRALVIDDSQRGRWPMFLKVLSAMLPNPAVEHGLDPDNPDNQEALARLRVHVDQIRPVWKEDVAEWYNELRDFSRNLMHPYDRTNPPSGPGWVIQVVGHHYNPYPQAREDQFAFGPLIYLKDHVLPRITNDASLRRYGISHATLTWFIEDSEWTNEKGAANNNLASMPPPLLERTTGPAMGADDMGMMGGMGMMGMMGGLGKGMDMGQGMMPDMAAMMMRGQMGGMMGGGYPGMMGGGYGYGIGAAAKKDLVTLTRTDFMVQFVWQPPDEEDGEPVKSIEEIRQELAEAIKNSPGAPTVREQDVAAASAAASKKVQQEFEEALKAVVEAVQQAEGAEPTAPADAPPAAAPPDNGPPAQP